MRRNLLVSGERANFTTLVFDTQTRELSVAANYEAPPNASWVEPSSTTGIVDRLIGLSEGLEHGLLYTFKINHMDKTCKVTSRKNTLGAPAHFVTLKDGSAIALGTYMGGSAALYPISVTRADGITLQDARRTEVKPSFPYESVGPNQGRQRQCHVHQILEDHRGLLYTPDLGADRVWIFQRREMNLEVRGWLQCPPGSGPRHAVFSPDEHMIYVIGELSHTVIAFDIPATPADGIQPIAGFSQNIIPSSVHPDHQFMMDSAEICVHPSIPNVLYVSNRWERHIREREPNRKNVPEELPEGDAVAIILLSNDGREVVETKTLRTGLDVIRGMRVADDGEHVALCGQEGGGVEIYAISGERGEIWTMESALRDGLEGGIKHAIWL